MTETSHTASPFNRLHRCSWPGCERVVPRSMWGCRAHWYALPRDIRVAIGRAYRHGLDTDSHPTRTYVDAYRTALAWIAERDAQRATGTHDSN
jgi:hypothetical protein